MREQIKLTWMHENKDYYNHIQMQSKNRELLHSLLDPLNTNGDVWTTEKNYYPLIGNKIRKFHPEVFEDFFIHRTMYSNKNNKKTQDKIIENVLDVLTTKNDTLAMALVGHEDEYVDSIVNAYLKGHFDNVDFDVSEIKFTKEEELPVDP